MNLMPSIMSTGALLAVVLGFGFIIFVHELGHFLAAKWVGIRVTQFAIGFGQSLLTWRKGIGLRVGTTEPEYQRRLAEGADPAALGETEYRLNWMPLGGYVKMLGQEDLDPGAASNDPRSFNCKPIWARAVVVSAGVVMNMITAVIFFIIAFMAGVAFPPAIIGGVAQDGPAAQVYPVGHPGDEALRGLRAGDHVTHINEKPISDFMELAMRVALADRDETLEFTVERDDYDRPLHYQIKPMVREDNHQLLSLGVAPALSLKVGEPLPGTELPEQLTEAGVTPGMKVVSVAGQPVQRYDQFQKLVAAAKGRPVPVVFAERREGGKTATVSLEAVPGLTIARHGENKKEVLIHLAGLVPAVQVQQVVPQSPAERGGLQAGDILVRVGTASWPSRDAVPAAVEEAGGEPIPITVLRDGKQMSLGPLKPVANKLGFYFGHAPVIARTLSDSPMGQLNLPGGSRILAINGQPVHTLADVQRVLQEALGPEPQATTLSVTYQLNLADSPTATREVQLSAEAAAQLAAAPWLQPLTASFDILRVPLSASNPVDATWLGIQKTHQFMVQTYITLARLFQGSVPVSGMRGPLGIAHEGTKVASQGWSYLMFFLGLISVNLAVINFLPMPIVDGGLMMFLIVEKLKGSPVSVKVQNAATILGLVLIASILLITLYHDATRLFGG